MRGRFTWNITAQDGSVLLGSRVRAEDVEDPIEIVDRGELDGQLPALSAHVDGDAGVETISEATGHLVQLWARDRSALGALTSRATGVAHSDHLFDRADGQTFSDNPLRQPLHGSRILESQKRPRMASAEHTGCDAARHQWRETQQAQGVGDLRARSRETGGEVFVGASEVFEELLIGGCLLKGVELTPVEVLQQRIAQHVVVCRGADDRRDDTEACRAGGSPPSFAHDQLVPGGGTILGPTGPHDDRLQNADLPDAVDQLTEIVLVEYLTGLTWVGHDGFDVQLGKLRPWYSGEAVV